MTELEAEEHGRVVARATLVTRTFAVVSIALLCAILYLLVTVSEDTNSIVADVEATQDTNTATVNSAAETLKLIRDCTEPNGDCYARGQQRTADAVAQINRVIILANACAELPEVETFEEVRSCVLQGLAARPR
jgi:hypothetical protein